MANRRRSGSASMDAKSKLFAISFVLSIVFGFLLLVVGKSYFKHIRAERLESRYTGDKLQGGSVSLDPSTNRLVSKTGDTEFVLTLDPEMQDIAESLFRKYNPEQAAFILMDATTGEILVMASYGVKKEFLPAFEKYQSCMDPILRSAVHPMASIAKIVTAAAAIEKNIAGPGDTFECANTFVTEGKSGIQDPKGVRHGRITMGRGLATSCNPTYAQIGLKVGKDNLDEYFEKFLFNHTIAFDMPLTESIESIGPGSYHLARAAAGFEGTWMSPVHAALIASAIQNDGVMMKPWLVKEIKKNGKVVSSAKPVEISKVVEKKTAETLRNMMEGTVNTPGSTAYRGFYKNGKPLIKEMSFHGKTGSINGSNAGEFYTWLVGDAQTGNRKLAYATMVVNGANWSIKAASYTGQFFLNASKEIE